MARLAVVVSILYACTVFGSIAEAVTPVRLVNGRDKFEGAVEVFYQGEWGNVCADRITQETANSICYMIYNGSIPHGNMTVEYSWDGGQGYDYMITNLHCNSSEEDIFFCDSNEWLHTRNHYCYNGHLILGCHTYIQENMYGTVTFSFDRQNNYTICRDHFDKEDAEVICRTQGLSSRNVRYYFDGYGYGTDGIMTAHCNGDENDLSECSMQPASYHCNHRQDVRVECLPTEVRLQQGYTDQDGILKVYYNGYWGRVCLDGFGPEEAQVACGMINNGTKVPGTIRRTYDPYHYYYSDGPYRGYMVNQLDCTGSEEDLSLCTSEPWNGGYCSQTYVVSLDCNTIRLANGNSRYEGRVEVFDNSTNEWGTVCDDDFDTNEARVICTSLGLYTGYARVAHYGSFPAGRGDILLDDLRCTGYENDLTSCSSSGWGRHNCGHGEDAGVYCRNNHFATSSPDVGIRLVGGSSYGSGRVEVHYGGEWGTICGRNLSHSEVQVICRDAGFYQGYSYGKAYYNAYFGKGEGNVVIEDLQCHGNESQIHDCMSKPWLSNTCSNDENFGVDCYAYNYDVQNRLPINNGEFAGAVRLMNGYTNQSGRVEVFYDGKWGTICDYGFDMDDAVVICRLLGMYHGRQYISVYRNAHFGGSYGPYMINNLQCSGYEWGLSQCPSHPWLTDYCGYTRGSAGIDCGESAGTTEYPWWIRETTDLSGYEGQVRLVGGGYYYGRVEVYSRGQWGTICDDGFDYNDVEVICRMLGLYQGSGYGIPYSNAHYGEGHGSIIVDDLNCNGYEQNIKQCSSNSWFSHNCGHSEDAGLNCYGYYNDYTTDTPREVTTQNPWWRQETTDLSTYEGQVRLVGGGTYYGRVEVYSRGQWGTICDDNFDHNDVIVICRMLGLYQGSGYGVPYSNAYYGEGYGSIIVDELNCYGYEQNIKQCSSNPWFSTDCGHKEDAALNCYDRYDQFTTSYQVYSTATPWWYHQTTTASTQYPWWIRETTDLSGNEGQVRLVGGNYYSGRVEVYSRGQWGTICDDRFDHNDVRVICRMLGLYQGSGYGVPYSSAYYGEGRGSIIVDDLNCNGYEQNIKQCSSRPWFSNDCGHSEDAGVNCYERYQDLKTPYQVYSTVTPWWYHQTTTGYRIQDAIFVNCNEYGWDVRVDMNTLRLINPSAKASDIYLGENSCNGILSWNTLIFNQGLRECLTSEMVRHNELVYRNELVYAERDPLHSFIIRHYNWTVGLECDVQRNETSSGHIHHNSNVNTLPPVSGNSHFLVNMSFFSDPNFQYSLHYPLSVSVGQNVYAKIFTTTSDWTIRMRVHTCYTKPSEFAPDHLKYYIIKNGCEVDSNTHIISQSSHETRIVFQDFEYTSSHEGLYVFCDANFCSSQDFSRNCQQTCNPVVRRNLPHRPALVTEDPIGISETTEMNTDD